MSIRRTISGWKIAAALALSLAAAGGAVAQIAPFRSADLGLDEEDFRLMEAAAAKLYTAEPPALNGVERWTNPRNGNTGTVTLLRAYTWQNMPCRQLMHRVTPAKRADPATATVDRCRTAGGEWKLRL